MRSIVVMGVCGTGKTTVGIALAEKMNVRFIDGDDLHPRANVMKMGSGIPLNDEDRQPWLERIGDVFYSMSRRSACCVIVCSALKRKYRDIIRQGDPNLIFVHLAGSKELVLERMAKRKGHYMKPEMVQSQFDTLEVPGDDEKDVVTVDIDHPIDEVIELAYEAVIAKEKELDNAK